MKTQVLSEMTDKYLLAGEPTPSDFTIHGVESELFEMFSEISEKKEEDVRSIIDYLVEDKTRFAEYGEDFSDDDDISTTNKIFEGFCKCNDSEIIKHLLENNTLTVKHLNLLYFRGDVSEKAGNKLVDILEIAAEVCSEEELSLDICRKLPLLKQSILSVRESVSEYNKVPVGSRRNLLIQATIDRNAEERKGNNRQNQLRTTVKNSVLSNRILNVNQASYYASSFR